MSDPVRDTRQAVDAARRELLDWLDPESLKAIVASDLDAFESAVRADERRETFARGDDATTTERSDR